MITITVRNHNIYRMTQVHHGSRVAETFCRCFTKAAGHRMAADLSISMCSLLDFAHIKNILQKKNNLTHRLSVSGWN